MAFDDTKQEGRAIRELLRTITEGSETAFDVAREIIGEGAEARPVTTVVLRQRRVNPEPAELAVKDRSPRRMHRFYQVDGFCDYLSRYGQSECVVVFADPSEETVHAVLDEKSAEGFECVTFTPQVHPLAEPWLAALENPMPIRSFVDFLIANRRQVVVPDAKSLVMTLQQVKMSKQVELWQGQGKGSVNGIKVSTEIAGEQKGVIVDIPDTLTVSVPLYVGQACQDIDFDLIVDGSEKTGVIVSVKSSDVATSRVAAFEQFVATMREKLTTGFTVGLGCPCWADWKTLPQR